MRPPYDGPQAHAAQVVEERRRVDLALRQRVQQPAPNLPGNKRDRYAIGAVLDPGAPALTGVAATGGGRFSHAVEHPDYGVNARIVLHLPGVYVVTARFTSANTCVNAHGAFVVQGGDLDVSTSFDHGAAYLIEEGVLTNVGVMREEVSGSCAGDLHTTDLDDYLDLSVDVDWIADEAAPVPTFTGALSIIKYA